MSTTIERLKFGMVNCYLIKGEKCSILVDTGNKGDRNALYERVKDEKVSLILLTHGHIDHIANANYLAQKLKVLIAMHEGDLELSKDNTINNIYSNGVEGGVIKYFSKMAMKGYKYETLKPLIFVKGEDSLVDYGINGKIIELKGHTAGSIGILIDEKELIVGDAMINITKPSVASLFEDRDAMLESISIIKKTKAEMIYVGHGVPFEANKFFVN